MYKFYGLNVTGKNSFDAQDISLLLQWGKEFGGLNLDSRERLLWSEEIKIPEGENPAEYLENAVQ